MKKKTLKKIERSFALVQKAADLIYDADDEIFYEDVVMVNEFKSIQDEIKDLCGETRRLKQYYEAVLHVIKELDL